MYKLISHVLMLAVDASLGVWWGVYHPVAANNLVQQEEAKIAQAKVELLQRLNGNPHRKTSSRTSTAKSSISSRCSRISWNFWTVSQVLPASRLPALYNLRAQGDLLQ